MFDIRFYLALFLGKASFLFLRMLKKEGSAAPGLLSLKIDPHFLEKIAKEFKYSIIVSGTNGKTTTCRMISAIIKEKNTQIYANRTGSNLLRGIASTYIQKTLFFKNSSPKIAVWEVDEGIFPYAVDQLKPKIIVLTNLFRDQLDRYGEIQTTAKKWQKALQKLPASTNLILNSDDPLVASLAPENHRQVTYYGIRDKNLGTKKVPHASDVILCPACDNKLNYHCTFLSHLGLYQCPNCQEIQKEPTVVCQKAKRENGQSWQIELKIANKDLSLNIKTPGLYNIYNLLAACSVGEKLNFSKNKIKKGLNKFQLPFGRFEEVKVADKQLHLILTKNPTALNQAIRTVVQINKEHSVVLFFLLNDLIADGRDVSWVWDADFNYLNKLEGVEKVFTAGIRGTDFSLRIKYSQFKYSKSKLKVLKSLMDIFSEFEKINSKKIYLFASYTAILQFRKLLEKKQLLHSRWED